MRDDAAYRALLGAILRDKHQLFGEVAVRRARAVPGLEVGDDGTLLRLEGDPLAILEAVLATFERLSGRASTISARGAVWRLRLSERYPGLELPAALR